MNKVNSQVQKYNTALFYAMFGTVERNSNISEKYKSTNGI